MKPIPTAESFMRREYDDNRHIDEFAERQIDMKHAIWAMQEFAKLHVEAALEAASKVLDVNNDGDYVEHPTSERILKAYPSSKIV